MRSGLIFLLGLYALTYSPFGQWLEASMPRHVLIQIPCLILIGYVYGNKHLKNNTVLLLINEKGLAGILLCIFIGAYWMVPRALDASLAGSFMATAKYLSLSMLVGIPLAISWEKMNVIGRAVVKIEFLTMLYRLGWLYLVSPNRLCNFYQLNEQVLLGKYFLIIATILSFYWLVQLFSKDYREIKKDKEKYNTQTLQGSG